MSYDIDVPPPCPRLHRTGRTKYICGFLECNNNTFNVCGYCIEHYPGIDLCHCSNGHWLENEGENYKRKTKAHLNWRFILRIVLFKKLLGKYANKVAKRIYAPGKIGYLNAKKRWDNITL